ncbi:MAG: DoxX family membrane protein [Saprospiraceae bacterium]
MKSLTIFYIALRLFLGGYMVYGGIGKFTKPMPEPTTMIEQLENEGPEKLKSDMRTLKIRNYIFGMKQTGYAWQLVGIAEIVCGLLILSQYLSFIGAVMLVPVTLQIFFFHLYLEPDEMGELLLTASLLLANLLLIGKEWSRWKGLVLVKP